MLLDNPCAPDVRVQREAAALRQAGARVRVLCWDRECTVPEREDDNGILLERIRTPSTRRLGARQLRHLLEFYRNALRRVPPGTYDVVHAHDLLMLPLGARLARRGRVPLVYDAHEIYHVMEHGRYPDWVLSGLARFERFLLRRSVDAFITVSRQRVRDYWARVAPGRRAWVVGNWYDPVEPSLQTRQAARDSLDIPRDATCIAYAGGLAAERRLDLLIGAAAKRPYTFFLVAGRGDPAIEHQFREADARHRNVRFTGWLRDPEPLYDAADALYYLLDPAHPYSPHAASNTLHIAIARRLPLITSRVGEPGQVMAAVDPRLVLDPPEPEALLGAIDLLGDPREYARAREAMYGLQGRFNWSRASETLLEAYRSLGGAESGHPA